VSATAAEPMIEVELWVSFASLLQAYTAAASVNLETPPRVEAGEGFVAIVAADARTDFRFDTATLRVESEKRSHAGDLLAQRSFEILPDGTIEIGGSRQDMDHVAINLVGSALARDEHAQGGRR
jgi:hypothetical protein